MFREAPFYRKRMTQTMLKAFNVPTRNLAIRICSSLCASRPTSDIVMDSGDVVSHTVPTPESSTLHRVILRLNVADGDFTEFLMKIFLIQRALEQVSMSVLPLPRTNGAVLSRCVMAPIGCVNSSDCAAYSTFCKQATVVFIPDELFSFSWLIFP